MEGPVLADADALIDFTHHRGAAPDVRRLVMARRLRAPVVAAYELWRGADAETRVELRRVLRGVPVVWLTQQDADAAADVWRDLTMQQRDLVGDRDILIAGTALARGWPLLTRNREHFRLTGVELLGSR
jgi:predicted nucleic acid-binding protein